MKCDSFLLLIYYGVNMIYHITFGTPATIHEGKFHVFCQL